MVNCAVVLLLALCSAGGVRGQTYDSESNTLKLVAKNGRRQLFGNVRHKPIASLDGRWLYFVCHTGGGFENEGESVFSFRRSDGKTTQVLKSVVQFEGLSPVASRSGKQGAVVTMCNGA